MSASIATTIRLLSRLTEAGIRYCHWKSNAHLEAGLAGATDLDLLFDMDAQDHVHRVLTESGFRVFPVRRARFHPGMEDYFGVDEVSGALLHLHVHYTILVGPRHLKATRLPWEHEILSSRVLDPEHGVYIAAPAVEMLLLIVRAAMKIRLRTRLAAFGRQVEPPDGLRSEFEWLSERVTPAEVVELSRNLLGDEVTELVQENLETGLQGRSLVRLQRRLKHDLRSEQTHRTSSAVLVRWAREARWFASKVNRRFLHAPLPASRSGSSGGLVVALIGSDGSGKSTLLRELDSWLGRKVDVMSIYFGSGDGPASVVRLPLIWLRAARQRLRGSEKPTESNKGPTEGRAPVRGRSVWRVLWALALAWEKHRKLKTVKRARARGFIVLCDRYPQAEVGGMNDGPMLHEWVTAPSRFRRFVARREARPYHEAERIGPDVLVRLIVTPEVALARKPHESLEKLRTRREVMSSLRFPGARRRLDVDADRPIEDVLSTIKRDIWPEL